MYGGRQEFIYRACKQCETLSLVNPPSDWAPFYGKAYYSYSSQSPIKLWIKSKRNSFEWDGKSLLGHLFFKLFGSSKVIDWVKKCRVNKHSRIVDIGCGSGQMLRELAAISFSSLTGIDPFMKVTYESKSLKLKKMILWISRDHLISS